MSKTLRVAALTLAAGSAFALLPAATATAAANGTMQACLTRNTVGGTGGMTLTADGPVFKAVGPLGQFVGTQCANWNVPPGQYVVDANNGTTCAYATSTVTRDGRTKTLDTTPTENSSPGLFGLTNVASGKTTRVDWVLTCP